MSYRRLPLIAAAIVIAGACTGQPGSSPGTSASPDPSGQPSAEPVGAIDHPTGATDIVLRMEEGGGFVPVEFVLTQTPQFTLYGDGTIIFQAPPSEAPPPAGGNGVVRQEPLRVGRLTEAEIQALLEFAIADGGLGLASKDLYDNPMVADAPTTTFTIHAGGLDKTFGVVALGIDSPDVPNKALRAQFLELAERLRPDEGDPVGEAFIPERYRGILVEGRGGGADWPWPDIGIDEFTMPGDEEGPAFPSRVMTPAEIEATGVTEPYGGFQNLLIEAPDGTAYAFVARPLLPDETR
jgi:hypothetical protein